jgi:hypothetical protein
MDELGSLFGFGLHCSLSAMILSFELKMNDMDTSDLPFRERYAGGRVS